MIDLVYLFEHSSNVASVIIAQMMGKYEYYGMLKKFGFGDKTGIDLPGESVGLLKPPAKWDASDLATMGYGYGSSVTAIQMVSAVSALANDIEVHKVKAPINKAFFIIIPPIIVLYKFIKGFY